MTIGDRVDLSSSADILRKKIRPHVPVAGPCHAWWQADAERVIRAVFKSNFALDVVVTEVRAKAQPAPDALNDMAEVAVPFLVDALQGRTALCVLDGELSDGLIEQQLLGKLLPTKRLDRPVTSIDAGLAESFVQHMLAGIGAEATDGLKGLALKSWEPDRAALRLALGEGGYDVFEAQLDMGPSIKSGWFQIWVPAAPAAAAPKKRSAINPDMVAHLQEYEIALTARMEGCVVTAAQIRGLKPDDVLSFPKEALSKVELVDDSGRVFAKGKLGQLHGCRAVKVESVAHSQPKPDAKAPPSEPTLPAAAAAAPDEAEPVLEDLTEAPQEVAAE